jgi:hypothetical protein
VIGFDALLRAPLLKSPEFPNGRLQPYLRVGPALFGALTSREGSAMAERFVGIDVPSMTRLGGTSAGDPLRISKG